MNLAEKKLRDAAEMAAHKARLDAWLGPDDRKPDPFKDLPRTKPVSKWTGFSPLVSVLRRIGPAISTPVEIQRHKTPEFGRFGRPIARADRGRILALARRLNADTRSPRRQGCLKATGLLVLETLMFQFVNHFTGRCDPSIKTIARAAGVGIRTVTRAIRRLKEAGLLSWRRRFDASNRYAIGQSGDLTPGFKIIEGGEDRAALLYQACRALALPESLIQRYGLG